MFGACKKNNQNGASARVVDGKLILSFPEALTPIVWQMDLTDAKSSSFEVVQDNDTYALISKKSGAQKKETIAPFAGRDDAVNALMATSRALENAHGQIREHTSANTNTQASAQAPVHHYVPAQQNKGGALKWVLIFGGIIVIVMLLMMANAMQPRNATSLASASGGYNNQTQTESASTSSGVPVSADDFLRSR